MKQKRLFGLLIAIALIAIVLLGSSPTSAAPVAQSATQTRTATATAVITPTNTTVPPADKSVITPTATTAVTPTKTSTVIPPTATLPKPTATQVVTATAKPTTTITPTAVVTKTATITPTAVVTKTATITPTATVTKTATATPTTLKALAPRLGTVATLSTAFTVQNLDAATTANVTAAFYNTGGSTVGSGVTSPIGPRLNSMIDQRVTGGGLDGQTNWQGSVVLSSNTQLAAVVDQFAGFAGSLGADFRFDTYTGLSGTTAATRVVLPQVLKNVTNTSQGVTYNSTIAIQNTSSSAAANVTITYTNRFTSNLQTVHTISNLPANTSAIIDMQTVTDNVDTLGRFFGPALITSDQPVAVVVNQNGNGALITYLGFTDANKARTLYLSQVLGQIYNTQQQKNWYTGEFATSYDGQPMTLTVTYTNRWTGLVNSETFPNSPTANIDQGNNAILQYPFYGSAVLTADRDFVVITNMVTFASGNGVRTMAYRGFTDANGASTIYFPQLFKNYNDAGTGVTWYTAIAGALSGNGSGSCTMQYYYNGGPQLTPETYPVSSSSPTLMWDQGGSGVSSKIPDNTLLSGVATCTGVNIVTTVNTVGTATAPGDASGNYPGVTP